MFRMSGPCSSYCCSRDSNAECDVSHTTWPFRFFFVSSRFPPEPRFVRGVLKKAEHTSYD